MALLLCSCGRVNGFDVSSKDAFVSSCVASAEKVGKEEGMSSRMVSRFFFYAAIPPQSVSISRNFNPTSQYEIPTYMSRVKGETTASICGSIWPRVSDIAAVGPDASLNMGILALTSALNTDIQIVRNVRREIRKGDTEARSEYLHVRETMRNYVPRVSAYRVVEYRGRRVPTIVMEAANAVGKPIDAFMLTVKLVTPDGRLVGRGRVRFNVPVPLGPGQESSYVLNFAGVSGLDIPDVVGYPGELKAVLSLDDIIAEGTPILAGFGNQEDDKKRMLVLAVVENDVFAEKNRLARVRIALATHKK